jgi:hypothetical protein
MRKIIPEDMAPNKTMATIAAREKMKNKYIQNANHVRL